MTLQAEWQQFPDPLRQLACLCGLFALMPIPRSALEQVWERAGRDPVELDPACHQLVERGWLSDGLSLTQRHWQFLRAQPEIDPLRCGYAAEFLDLAKSVPQSCTQQQVAALRPSMPHLEELAGSWLSLLQDSDLNWPFIGLARYYESQGFLQSAQKWYQKGLQAASDRLGSEHAEVATCHNNLAAVLHAQGLWDEAVHHYARALHIRERALGANHPQLLTILSNYAAAERRRKNYSSALSLLQRALSLSDVSMPVLVNLADTYACLGRFSEASQHYQEALQILHLTVGPGHPAVATVLNNLGKLAHDSGDLLGAEVMLRQALALQDQALGRHHPDTATTLNNLGTVALARGLRNQAEQLYREALDIRRFFLGDQHPDCRATQENLRCLPGPA